MAGHVMVWCAVQAGTIANHGTCNPCLHLHLYPVSVYVHESTAQDSRAQQNTAQLSSAQHGLADGPMMATCGVAEVAEERASAVAPPRPLSSNPSARPVLGFLMSGRPVCSMRGYGYGCRSACFCRIACLVCSLLLSGSWLLPTPSPPSSFPCRPSPKQKGHFPQLQPSMKSYLGRCLMYLK